jgi:predicted transcriptional regulator
VSSEQIAASVLISVRPRFADLLLDGSKTVELRRNRTLIPPGSVGLVYSSSPQRALVGAVRFGDVRMRAPSTIWKQFGSATGLTRREFNAYLAGVSNATALVVEAAQSFPEPVNLAELRLRWDRFVAPQNYRYLPPAELGAILNGEASIIRGLRHRW